MQVVVVKWQDSTTFGHWLHRDAVDSSSLKIAYAAGFLLANDKKVVRVALLLSDDKQSTSNWINIPKKDVLEITILREVDWENENGR